MIQRSLKPLIIGFFLFISILQPVVADDMTGQSKTTEELQTNVDGFRDYLVKGLSQFPTPDPSKPVRVVRAYSRPGRTLRVFTARQYDQASKSNWVKANVMQGLSLLSQQLANTAGTAFAPQSASQLQQYAAQLGQSSDPQFQEIGSLYTQEAQALQTGNIQGVDQAAVQVSDVPQPEVTPGYQPTNQESALVSAFNNVLGTVLAGLGGVLGTLVVNQLLQSLGITNLNSLLGLGQSTGSAVASGQNPGTALDNAGAGVVQTSGEAVMQQLGTINVQPRQSQDSANAGGVPPAQ